MVFEHLAEHLFRRSGEFAAVRQTVDVRAVDQIDAVFDGRPYRALGCDCVRLASKTQAERNRRDLYAACAKVPVFHVFWFFLATFSVVDPDAPTRSGNPATCDLCQTCWQTIPAVRVQRAAGILPLSIR